MVETKSMVNSKTPLTQAATLPIKIQAIDALTLNECE